MSDQLVEILQKAMEIRTTTLISLKNQQKSDLTLDDETVIGSHASPGVYKSKMEWLGTKFHNANKEDVVSKMATMFTEYHKNVNNYRRDLLDSKMNITNVEQKRLINGMGLQNRKLKLVEFELMQAIKDAHETKLLAYEEYQDGLEKENFMKIMSAIVNLSPILSMGPSSALQTVVQQLPNMISSFTTVNDLGSKFGCDISDIIVEMKEMAKRTSNLTNFDHFKSQMNEPSSLASIRKYDSFRIQEHFKRTIHCMVAQDLSYQSMHTVQAKKAVDKINEFFNIQNVLIDLQEKWSNNQRSLHIWESQKSSLDDNWAAMTENVAKEIQIICDFFELEFATLKKMAEYIFFLETKFRVHLGKYKPLLEDQLKLPLQIPFSGNIDHLHDIKNNIGKWKEEEDKSYKPQPSTANPWRQILHLRFNDPILLDKLREDFTVTLEIPMNQEFLNAEIIGVHSHPINPYKNTKVSSAFARLDFDSTFPNMPEELYVHIEQSSRSVSMIAGENIVSMSPNSIKRNNIFNVMQPEDDQKILENLTDQCLVKENEKKGSDPFCSSPFSSYTLIVKQGNMTNCPQIETQENCKGLSLEGLKAIHLYLKYYIV